MSLRSVLAKLTFDLNRGAEVDKQTIIDAKVYENALKLELDKLGILDR